MKKQNEDCIIAIARPSGMVATNNMWYDFPMKLIGFCKSNGYQVGHAAAVLIEKSTGQLTYCDFGRYHTPIQWGRARDEETDPPLSIPFRAQFGKDGSVENLHDILIYVNNNKPCHGEGEMYASIYYGADYNKGYSYLKKLQSKGIVRYGPFEYRGSNCSRFVNSICRASFSCTYTTLRRRLAPSITPTTKHNVLVHNTYYYVNDKTVRQLQRPSFIGKRVRNAKRTASTTKSS